MKNNMEILSNKSVATMTGHELLELFQLLQDRQKESRAEKQSMNDYLGFPRFVTGIKELARVLNISVSTVNRWKSDGLLDEATYQNGKFVLFDVYGVLDILRVSNQKGKYNQPKYSNKI